MAAAMPTTRCFGRSWAQTAADPIPHFRPRSTATLAEWTSFRVSSTRRAAACLDPAGCLSQSIPTARQQIQSGYTTHGWSACLVWQRCLGTRLLPELSEPPARLPEGLVENGKLGQGEGAT